MKHTDPTYLRTIYDGLNSGAIHKDNASALPLGLVGMYEAAFPPTSNVNNRKKVLDFFAIWSLLRREVSAAFVLPLLEGWTEEQLLEYIARYSKWFNSPVSGKYQLYHERFRAFILQKISHQQFSTCNNLIINQCQRALLEKNGNEWEPYALECLSKHLLIKAMENGDGSALKSVSYNTSHWNRQIEISKGFDWSKRMLNDMMLWAYKYNEEEVIECALNKVDLQYLEQDDAPRIIELVAHNDIETAIQRLESFGGNDNEGLQRKFILYMLCFIELTLLESKDKPFKKEAIEKLLKHFDDNIPVDHSVLNWNDFFPSYLVFLISVEIKKIDLDYSELYKRTEIWENEWIKNNGPYTEVQIEVMLSATKSIIENTNKFVNKIEVLKFISIELFKQGNIEKSDFVIWEAIEITRSLSDQKLKCSALNMISNQLARQGKSELSYELVKEALDVLNSISDEIKKSYELEEISNVLVKLGKIEEAKVISNGIINNRARSSALVALSIEMSKQSKVKESDFILMKALQSANDIVNDSEISYALKDIITQLAKNRMFDKALEIVNSIIDDGARSSALKDISAEFASLGKVEEALKTASFINSEIEKNYAHINISNQLVRQGLVELALAYARTINIEGIRSTALITISTELAKQGKSEVSDSVADEAIETACSISEIYMRSQLLNEISTELAKQGKIEEALKTASVINIESYRFEALKSIYSELSNLGKINESVSVILKSIKPFRGINDENIKNSTLWNISNQLANQGMFQEALETANIISELDIKCSTLKDITFELAKQGKLQDAMETASVISIKRTKSTALKKIAIALVEQGNLYKALEIANSISSENEKCFILMDVSIQMSKQSKIKESDFVMREALETARKISDQKLKSSVLNNLSNQLAIQEKFELSSKIGEEALKTVSEICDEDIKSYAFMDLSSELAKQNKFEEALRIARGISDINFMSYALEFISTELAKHNKFVEAFEISNGISEANFKSKALKKIYFELAKQGKIYEANKAVMTYSYSNDRIGFWKKLGRENYLEKSMAFCITQLKTMPNDEAVFFYKRGMTEAITATNTSASNVLELLELVKEDTKSIAHLLQMHALYLCFFEKTNPIKMQRLNKTLNIQWALDIAAKFEKEFERASQNVQEWINEIVDENDREDVLSWAEKVEQGKMTEEKFLERINKL